MRGCLGGRAVHGGGAKGCRPAMNSQTLRRTWIEFFESKGHKHLPGASLVPEAMSSTLFTIAGMEPFVPVFLGEAPAPAPRVVTVQRCLRVAGAKSDIENVGRTGRHGTFLEMLGNFSFGDYYKREAIAWAWEFVTERLGIDKSKLHVTVHTSDDEAQEIWEREIGLSADRISRWDEDNFWTMGPTGPCGPCSEIFYDLGPSAANGPDDTGPNKGDRYLEIWNLVFQQYNRTPDGKLHDLPRKAIDTGAGLERVLTVVNGMRSMYETDLFEDIVHAQPNAGQTALSLREQLVRRRIIADHIRAITFLITDGVYPSNTDRGYVLRFLTRRAIRMGRLLDLPQGFLTELVPAVVASLGDGYPELREAETRVMAALAQEEAQFNRTLVRGSEILAEHIAAAQAAHAHSLDGETVFLLHDTYGFPWELTREVAGEQGLAIDVVGFEQLMEQQRERARADASAKRAVVQVGEGELAAYASEFVGYGGLEAEGTVLTIVKDGASVDALTAGESGQLILDRTSFYAEKGGQIGDHGMISRDGAWFAVEDAQYLGEAIAHIGSVERGTVHVGDRVRTAVDPAWRREIRRHHTSAHLLQRALKDVLGDEVVQAGSWVGTDRMRFDFRWPGGPLTDEQRSHVSERVNEMIRADHHLATDELPIEQARRSGAIMMHGEKYGELVRVVHAGPSVEFCGGTHAHTTGELGLFLILSESSVGSGVRRIECCVSTAAERYVEQQQKLIGQLSATLAARPDEIPDRIGRLQEEVRTLQRGVGDLRAKMAAADAAEYIERAETIGGSKLVAAEFPGFDRKALTAMMNAVRGGLQSGVVALAGVSDGEVALLVGVSDDLVARGVKAGDLLKAMAEKVDGRGGGRPNLAQGGGKNPSGVPQALAAVREALLARR
ncbi:alanine--tRNA ligase [bacterium]|nr:MAG: alanine--tRNA ligase [bacterium]